MHRQDAAVGIARHAPGGRRGGGIDQQLDVVCGFGGYVSIPAYLGARRARIPFVIHEANAKAGIANRAMSRSWGERSFTFDHAIGGRAR